MDTSLLRTFLEVNRTRHFAKAARNLFVTQAAVSARIRQLEDTLGTPLFTRQRNNIQLTVAGRRLLPHAEAILGAWNRALLDTSSSDEDMTLVAVGCVPSIWETYLDDWLEHLYAHVTNAQLLVRQAASQTLVADVRERTLSFALTYEPPTSSDLVAERVADVSLALCGTHANPMDVDRLDDFVYVDWGTAFAVELEASMPRQASILRVNTPSVALRFLLANGGCAYLPTPMTTEAVSRGQLYLADAPTFLRPVFLTRTADPEPDAASQAVIDNLTRYVA